MLEGTVAVFGGSFNPPHMGHQLACLYLLEGMGAQGVWLVPTYTHAFGKALAPFADRVAMCQRLAAPLGERVAVLQTERDANAGGRSYLLMQALRRQYPQQRLALVIGGDILHEVHKWYKWDALRDLVHIVVLGRQGFGDVHADTPLALPAVSSTEVRRRLQAGENVHGLVPVGVAEYVQQHGLYRE